jgi:hypothetical protein
MNASASLRWTQIPAGAFRSFLIALVAAFVLGGAGGYIVRGMSASTATENQTTNQPFVTEPIPYSSATPTPAPQRTPGPDGFTI